MAGLVPAIDVLLRSTKDVDARPKAGHDGKELAMHDIKWIRENRDAFDQGLMRRNLNDAERKLFSSEQLLSIDERRRAIIRVREKVLARCNEASKENHIARKKNDQVAVARLAAEVAQLKAEIQGMEAEEKTAAEELRVRLVQIPNLPTQDVPDGKNSDDNIERHHFGAKRNYSFQPKQHFDLGEALGFMDFETAAKLSGARFVVLKSGLARMERAIGQFMVNLHATEHGYTEVSPPLLVKDEIMFGTGQLPKFEEDQFEAMRMLDRFEQGTASFTAAIDEYKRQHPGISYEESNLGEIVEITQRLQKKPWKDRLWLIPTAEVPLTNFVRESIVEEDTLPRRLTAHTPCFRAEAGAAGKDTRGMIRQHQFSKVELVSITTPEQSKDEHERMLSCAEEVLRRLGLHYRVVTLCTGDMGFASQKTYDIEVWLPGQGAYREISSCSNCGDFQARRMDARYRTRDRAVRHVHTLNGSGVAVGRALIAVMETYQDEGGRIAVPDVLQGYMGGMKVIEKAA
jgi:seryl-tRNA synthetase